MQQLEPSSGSRQTVLIVDSAAQARRRIAQALNALSPQPLHIREAATARGGLAAVEAHKPSSIILDLDLNDSCGLDLITDIRAHQIQTPIIVHTARASIATAVDAMKRGAADFLMKPAAPERLAEALEASLTLPSAILRAELVAEANCSGESCARPGDKGFQDFVGGSAEMQSVYDMIRRIASSNASVFITGESGTGKDVAARAIHALSKRKDGPFFCINCSAIPKDLMESEIFGHVRGAFTGAMEERDGAAMMADGGTLFLDEICEMDLSLQAKILRFVQTGTVKKVGGSKGRKVDVRFVCATNRPPLEEVKAGRFRQDLYYRLHVVPVDMPPLRARGGDIIEIAETFLSRFATEEEKRFTGFNDEAMRALERYDWPGNVRELQNVMRKLVVLNDGGGPVCMDMLPPEIAAAAARPITGASILPWPGAAGHPLANPAEAAIRPLWQVEQDIVEGALSACNGNVHAAARALEINPSTIYRKRQHWAMKMGIA